MRVALFVEGGSAPAPPRRDVPLVAIWRHLARAIGFGELAPIVPIAKKDIVVMDRSIAKPRSPGSAEGLDQLMARWLKRSPFDAAVVAWDLVPALDREREVCRWEETLALYRGLGESSLLPEPWRDAARRRFEALSARDRPPIAKAIGADARYDKDPWLEYLLRRLLDDPEARALVLAHPICRRLAECLAPQ